MDMSFWGHYSTHYGTIKINRQIHIGLAGTSLSVENLSICLAFFRQILNAGSLKHCAFYSLNTNL